MACGRDFSLSRTGVAGFSKEALYESTVLGRSTIRGAEAEVCTVELDLCGSRSARGEKELEFIEAFSRN